MENQTVQHKIAENQTAQRRRYSTAYLSKVFLWFYCPSLYIHRSHVDSKIPYKIFHRLLDGDGLARRNHFRLSKIFATETPDSLDTKEDLWSFVTMSNYHLDYVIRMVAALEVGRRIRVTISKTDINHLHKIFGSDVISFVCRRYAGFYDGGTGWKTVDFSEFNETLISKLGWAFLYHARTMLPPNLLNIWLMRLPKKVDLTCIDSSPSSEEAFRLCVSLFEEVSNI
ncbi:SctK family type III secretion system sorting platform protein [Candidatus Ichthyocystis hellenicum]|uniref:SctK family type III secretion system sorting platform protein n=1 Tax=Candidatus Ichthyocystis hellenicum TaxID=1561003 RepID=UPI000B88A62C|nr:SctK family type III secretion system sorting platform protein [Candidatus Ichthyocystis hellenicum]